MTIEELLKAAEQNLEAVDETLLLSRIAQERDPVNSTTYIEEASRAIPIFLQKSLAYSQLAMANIKYKEYSNNNEWRRQVSTGLEDQ